MVYKAWIVFLLMVTLLNVSAATNISGSHLDNCMKYNYLDKPTGDFSVGFQDFEWLNRNDCPDLTATVTSKKHYHKNNKKRCRRIVVRVYYPSRSHSKVCSVYPAYVLDGIRKSLQGIKIPALKKDVSKITKHLSEVGLPSMRGLIFAHGKFPVLIFSPGARDNFKEYSSLLINLVSHGYIVVAINDSFLTNIKFPGGQVIKQNPELSTHQIYVTKYLDLNFVYQKLFSEHQGVFKHMDLGKLGVFGHSAGASAVIALVRAHPGKIKAAAALDAPNTIAWKNKPHLPAIFNVLKKFNLPVIQLHSSYAKIFLGASADQYQLSRNEFLVRIAPNYKNVDYFKHMDFTDYTLFKSAKWMQPLNDYYLRNKKDNPVFPSLLLGTVSGKVAIRIVSDYLLAFFDTYLLGKPKKNLATCKPLVLNTLIRCG